MDRLVFAAGVGKRLRGLLFSQPSNTVLMLVPCRDIHTFGMRYALDVAFLDGKGQVVEVRRDLLPNKRMRCRRAAAVVERFASPKKGWYEVGDYLQLNPFEKEKEQR